MSEQQQVDSAGASEVEGGTSKAEVPTPGPWFVRKLERDGELVDCFVAAKDVNGFAYDAEILGDDEYREGAIARKLADCEMIVRAVNSHADLVAALNRCVRCLELYGPPSAETAVRDARAALTKAGAAA